LKGKIAGAWLGVLSDPKSNIQNTKSKIYIYISTTASRCISTSTSPRRWNSRRFPAHKRARTDASVIHGKMNDRYKHETGWHQGWYCVRWCISRDEACKISDKSFAHGFRDKRVVMFAGNRERAVHW
jgi:hypothetical protein